MAHRYRWVTMTGLAMAVLVGCGPDVVVPPNSEPPTIVTFGMPTAFLGEPYSHALSATGGALPYGWQANSGSLPPGLTLSTQGIVSGSPVEVGRWDFSVLVTGADGLSSQKALSITVEHRGQPRIETVQLPAGVVGVAYSFELLASGGSGTYAWRIVEGELPPGMTLTDGILSGSPTVDGLVRLVVEVTSGTLSDRAEFTLLIYASEPLKAHLTGLGARIEAFLRQNEEALSRNPHLSGQIQAKIQMLSEPGLDERILAERYFIETEVTSIDQRTVPVTLVFPADSMRPGALLDGERIPLALEVLEEFLGLAWPAPFVREWYGFTLGHGGGGGMLQMEDRGTYAHRGTVSHDAILPHELAHSWIGHEGLTQFLGNTYAHQVLETGSTDPDAWTVPDYTAFDPGNTNLFALIDIYALIGREGMGRAYRAIYQSGGVPYGSPLPSAARAAFVDEAPASVRAQVSDLVSRVH